MPHSAFIGQIIALLMITAFCIFFVLKLRGRQELPAFASLLGIAIAALLHLASAVYAFIRPITFVTRSLDVFLLHQSLIFSYYALDQLLNGAPYRPIWTTKLFQIVMPLTCCTILLDWFQPENLTSFPDGEPYHATALYFLSTFLNWAIITSLLALTIGPCWKNLKVTNRMPHRIRRILLIMAFAVSAVGLGLNTEIALIVSYMVGDNYRGYFLMIYQFSRIAAFTLVAIALTSPMPMLAWVAKPFEIRQQKRLSYLRNRLLTIVPNNELRNDILRDARVLIEISDASRIILTHHLAPLENLTPRREAVIIWKLLRDDVTYAVVGQQRPPAQSGDVQKYYLAVARYLRRLEQYHLARQQLVSRFQLRGRYGHQQD